MVIICTEGYHGRTTDICLNVTALSLEIVKKNSHMTGIKVLVWYWKKKAFLRTQILWLIIEAMIDRK